MRWYLTSVLCCLAALPALSNTLGDFDGDGKRDVLLRMTLSPGSDMDRAAGAWAVHLMDGATVRTGASGATEVTQDWAWRLAGIGDFNGDGKSDLMLRHFDGRFSLQAMNGRHPIAAESGGVDIDAGLDWRVEGIGDFDGDGKDDVLLRNAQRRWQIHAMDGHRVATRRVANLTRNPWWDVQGMGDLNGDGKDDVVLRRPDNGRWYAYLMNGHLVAERGVLPLTSRTTWGLASLGDLNGDGKDDVLLRREDGPWYYYPMDGLRVRPGRGYAGLSTNLDWRLAGVGDLDGDDRADVLLRHVNGRWHFQAMNGRKPIVGRGSRSPLTASRAWRVARPSPRIPPPPIDRDTATMNEFADAWRQPEFGFNPGLSEMNAHWAYARGLTGEGETVGMVDTGLYALHEEFAGRLHDETIYTVIAELSEDPLTKAHDVQFFKIGDRAPADAYPTLGDDTSEACRARSGIFCAYYWYGHGTAMASTSVAARNGRHGYGMAFGAQLLFRPFYHPGTIHRWMEYFVPSYPGEKSPSLTRHQRVRNVGDIVPIVSNAWLTGHATFHRDPGSSGPAAEHPFHTALSPGYQGYQQQRDERERSILVWAAGNRPATGGPITDTAALPSITERQIRAATGGERGLADVVLAGEDLTGLSAEEALARAEAVVTAWRKRWLAVVAVRNGDLPVDVNLKQTWIIECATGDRDATQCSAAHTLVGSARCGFASDWCVGAGSVVGNVGPLADRAPDAAGNFRMTYYETSEASATAGAALGVLMQAYRDGDGLLTVGTDTVLERLKTTADPGIIDHDRALDRDGRNIIDIEEAQVRALVGHAGATDDDLRELIANARSDFAEMLDELNLFQEENDSRQAFTTDERAQIEEAKESLRVAQWRRYHLLNRIAEYFSPYWREIDTFPPQLGRLKSLLGADPDSVEERDLLAQLIRQVEWIDEQLRRLGKTKDNVTDAEIRRITITSIVGHGLINMRAATDPAG